MKRLFALVAALVLGLSTAAFAQTSGPEVEIVATLAGMVLPGGPIDFTALKDHAAIRAAIARVVPGYAQIADVDRGNRSARRPEFEIPGRRIATPSFHTPSGRARAAVTPVGSAHGRW